MPEGSVLHATMFFFFFFFTITTSSYYHDVNNIKIKTSYVTIYSNPIIAATYCVFNIITHI